MMLWHIFKKLEEEKKHSEKEMAERGKNWQKKQKKKIQEAKEKQKALELKIQQKLEKEAEE